MRECFCFFFFSGYCLKKKNEKLFSISFFLFLSQISVFAVVFIQTSPILLCGWVHPTAVIMFCQKGMKINRAIHYKVFDSRIKPIFDIVRESKWKKKWKKKRTVPVFKLNYKLQQPKQQHQIITKWLEYFTLSFENVCVHDTWQRRK